MNTKDLKIKSETKIKSIVDKFTKTTGLSVGWIKVEKETPTGFVAKPEDTKVSIVIGD